MWRIVLTYYLLACVESSNTKPALVDVPTLITDNGYNVEVHNVTTANGYILTMHRIPHGINSTEDRSCRPVVLVMHGLMTSSADFVVMGPKYGLGYILADAGYDVWLGNAQGNRYSRFNTKLDPDSLLDFRFWDFTWEEIGTENIPCMVSYIKNKTSVDTIHYIGHSQGTTALLALCSLHPQYCKVFKSAHLMAPVAFLTHWGFPALNELMLCSDEEWMAGTLIDKREAFASAAAIECEDEKVICKKSYILYGVCEKFVSALKSHDVDKVFVENFPFIMSHFPSGSSLKQFIHYGQHINQTDFMRYNYGPSNNLLKYGNTTPPAYDLSAITNKINLIYSDVDTASDPRDVKKLHSKLKDAELVLVDANNFTHFDYLWSSTAKQVVYDKIITVMNELECS